MSAAPILYEESQGFAPWVYTCLALVLLLLLAVFTTRMRTSVTAGGVTIRYGFLGTTRVPMGDIAKAEAIVYRPLGDFGGWGLRGIGSRRAINARGNRGVRLTRRDGSTLLVGSQEPRRLLEALATAGVATEDKIPPEVREF